MLNTNKHLILQVCIILLFFSNNIYAKKETFYTCDNGFKFETKKNAARCIKQERLTFRPPVSCENTKKNILNTNRNPPNSNKSNSGLMVDKIGQKDMCVDATTKKTYALKCDAGYALKIRKGKDVCGKGKPEVVLPATNKVSR